MLPSDQRIVIGGGWGEAVAIRLDFPIGATATEINSIRERAKPMQAELAELMKQVELDCTKRRSEALD